MNCQICDQPARGKHFGATVCRACAAFFRRAVGSRLVKTCKNENRCVSFKKGCFTCKYCRLQKCFQVGMSSENFQFDRDNHHKDRRREKFKLAGKIPETMSTFCGRPSLIIFSAPTEPNSSRTFINLQFLFDETIQVLRQGPPTPIRSESHLEKLCLGFSNLKNFPEIPGSSEFGLNEAMSQLQHGILKFTKWLTYFDEFRELPQKIQLQMLHGTWTVWSRLENLASMASSIKNKISEETLGKMKKDTLIFKLDPMKMDTSWLSKYTLEEVKFFLDIPTEIRLDTLTRAMVQLSPSDMELSFMLGQLCFHYVGKRFQGEILQVSDRFQQILADDLHDYYVNQMKHPYYIKRVQSMMNINNLIQEEIRKHREKSDLAIVFDIFHVDVSHPDMFLL